MRILWIPHTGWHIPQRAHLFTRALAERHEVHVTDWIADFTRRRDYLSRRYLRNFTYRRYRDGKIHVHGIPRISPAIYFSSIRQLNTRLYSRFVERIITNEKIDVVVGTFVVPPPSAPRVIFDLFDENADTWRKHLRTRPYGDEIAAVEACYLQKADAIVVASSVLLDKARSINGTGALHLIPNGVSLELYSKADPSCFRKQFDSGEAIVGILANYDSKQELRIVLQVAKMLENHAVKIIVAGRGSALPWARRIVQNRKLSNVIFTGYVSPSQAPHLVSAFDVGVCAYAKTPMDDARSPMRLLMYAAAGIPTVCTCLEEVERMAFENVMLVDSNPESFADAIVKACHIVPKRPSHIDNYDLPRLITKYEELLAS